MPATIKAQRIQSLKERFVRHRDEKGRPTEGERAAAKATRFQRQWNAIHELLGVYSLSRVNQRWCKKAVVTMREEYPDAESQRMIGLLEERINRAIDRLLKRDAARAAAKEAGTSKPGRPNKTQPEQPAPVPGTSPVELWKAMLKKQQETKS